MSRSRTPDINRTDRSPTRSSSRRQQTTESKKSSQQPPDDANAGRHAFVKPPERAATRAQQDERSATPRATSQASGRTDYTLDATPHARERLERKLKRLEPPARSEEAARPRSYGDRAEDQHHGRETQAEQHGPMKLARNHGERTRTPTPHHDVGDRQQPRPRARSRSSPARPAKVWCGNNKLDKKLKANGGHLEIGSPSACFRRGVGGGVHQDVPPGEEDAFIEKWIQPYAKLVEQPIWYKDSTPPPPGMFACTLPQALARGFAVGSIQRAKKILKQRERASHGA